MQEVRHKDTHDPMARLEPNEQEVARMLARGMTNEQIAAEMGFRDKRTISRTNGQIYAAWGLDETNTDEKVARTRAALIVHVDASSPGTGTAAHRCKTHVANGSVGGQTNMRRMIGISLALLVFNLAIEFFAALAISRHEFSQ